MKPLIQLFFLLSLVTSLIGCGSDGASNGNGPWTWLSGSNSTNQTGNYGTIGTSSVSNVPGARKDAVSWSDSNGNLWLFGGHFFDSTRGNIFFNDLWKFDGNKWTWMKGSSSGNQIGNYGTKGIPATSNDPGSRYGAISWIDKTDQMWLFGGVDSSGLHLLNDLWKFDGSNWVWVSGTNVVDQSGTYGAKGTPAVSNMPGGRAPGASWIDADGHLWLWGGFGKDSIGQQGILNDLWKFDGSDWTWVSGSSSINQAGSYGVMNTPAASNVPGARTGASSWIDQNGNLWLFGGRGLSSNGSDGFFNDLWKFDGNDWIWVNGSNSVNQSAIYGTKGNSAVTNTPGARAGAHAWVDKSDNFWLYGGLLGRTYPDLGDLATDNLSDLWKFDGSNWTWVSGPSTANDTGNFGTKGTPTASNIPRARAGAVSWTDRSDRFWLMGGSYYQSSGFVYLNDLWYYQP